MRGTLNVVGWLLVLGGFLFGIHVIAVVGGEIYNWLPMPTAILVTAVAGVLPLLASLLAPYNQRVAARIYLWVAPFVFFLGLLFVRALGGPVVAAVIYLCLVVVPGLFWRAAAKRNWPSLLGNSDLSHSRRLSPLWVCGLSCTALVVAFFWSLGMPWWPLVGDCAGASLFDDRGTPVGIDFTAKILFVGPATYQGWSLWSVVRVEERFSGRTWWTPDTVILRGFFKPGDRSTRHFVEGWRSHAALTHFLPVIEPLQCGHTAPVKDAVVAIRILRDGPPKSGVRVIGRLYKGGYLTNGSSRAPLAGIAVNIAGPNGSIISVTDADGVYDAHGPPGLYKLHLATGDAHVESTYLTESPTMELKSGQAGGAAFYVR